VSEENEDNLEERDEEFENSENDEQMEGVIPVSGLYKNWFLDYASYVILERAVPHISDGLKPVQRRILHSMKEMDDGRYNKVANVIGNTMKYHPHGDASIGDAMVQIGQKELLIDCQGNWGNILTGDRAAAARYIEARLTKLALDIVFNPKTTNWQSSYDGRNKEPINLPMKFPLLLAQGAEGIAVGLSTKILPHNFNELIDASIKMLKGQNPKIFPDFITCGMVDVSNYNDGQRGGRVKVRGRIRQEDKKTLIITEIPFSTTTSSLIESVIKANDKGKIKIRKIEDNTAAEVEIVIHLPTGVSPDKTIDALYAFTDCEISISPNACVIEADTPRFIGVTEMLRTCTDSTRELLKLELEIKLRELQEQWHYSSLEKIFIEQKMYIEFDGKTYEEAIELTHKLLKPHVKHLVRAVTDDDVKRLMEIKMRRITKHDADKADTFVASLEEQMEGVKHHLANLIEYAIDYFKGIKAKYGEGKERKTEIKSFETIVASKVAVANAKLYVNLEEGFAGSGLKRSESEYLADCSDIDDVIAIRQDGTMIVSRISAKQFFGKNLLHVGVWKKNDERTVYNVIYHDGESGKSFVKRFNVKSITRDKEYPVTKGTKGSKILYMSANPNGEAEIVTVLHRQKANLKKPKFDFDFKEVAIKGRGAAGNTITKHLIKSVILKEEGTSTLGARKIWFDDTVQRLNIDERGELLGDFNPTDKILTVYQSGDYRLTDFKLSNHFDDDLILIEKWNPNKPVSAVYLDGDKKQYFVKRFLCEESDKKVRFISEHEDSVLEAFSADWLPRINVVFSKIKGKEKDSEEVNLEDFITIKGYKAQGNRLTTSKVKSIDLLDPLPYDEPIVEAAEPADEIKEDEEVVIVEDVAAKEPKEKPPVEERKLVKKIKVKPIEDKPATEVEFKIEDTTKKEEDDNPKPKKPPKLDTNDDGQITLF
jgi:topoisomerase-4 subunit A